MLHRCWRKGQEKDTKLYILLFENSVEEDIWQTVETKQTLAELFYKIKGV
jgi:SNF2 family DNA or RNA helicase